MIQRKRPIKRTYLLKDNLIGIFRTNSFTRPVKVLFSVSVMSKIQFVNYSEKQVTANISTSNKCNKATSSRKRNQLKFIGVPTYCKSDLIVKARRITDKPTNNRL